MKTNSDAQARAGSVPLPADANSKDGAPAAEHAASLPKVVVSGYASGEDVQDRFAVINDKIVREGEEAGPGLRLEQVTDKGVVMSYRGQRFRPAP